MATIALTYNEKNALAKKTIDYILSLGCFKQEQALTPAKKKTLQAIKDAKEDKGMTTCTSFEDYLKAVAE